MIGVARSDIAAVLALCAAVCIAIGDVMQHRSTKTVPAEDSGHLELFLALLKNPQWWLGSIVAAGGFVFQAAALDFGSVILVQALIATSLLFALPLNARVTGSRITRDQFGWAVLLAASVAVIVTVGNPTEGLSRASAVTWAWVAAVMGPLVAAALVAARRASGQVSAVLLAAVAGSLWGLFAVLTKGVVDRIGAGLWELLKTPELYAWAVVALLATMFQQSSFRAGSLSAALPAGAVSEPMVGSMLGIVVLGETVRPGDSGWALLIAAVVAMVLATIRLAAWSGR